MGVKLSDLVAKRELAEAELSGKHVAFDAYNVLYQFVSSIRTPEGYPLATKDGVVISHLKGLLSRTSHLVSRGIQPIFVFDGEPNELKKGTLDLRRKRKEDALKEWEEALRVGDMERARTKAMQTSRLTDEMVNNALRLLDLMGIPRVIAPADGEAQASYMCAKGDVFAASSQDFDSLLFGTPRLVRNLAVSGKRKIAGKKAYISVQPEIISLEETLDALGITREQLVDIAILVGTDFNPGVKGIGPKKALKLIRKYGNLENACERERIPLLEFDSVRRIFLDPDVTDDYSTEGSGPDMDGVMDFLVGELGFSKNSVEKHIEAMVGASSGRTQVSLDRFF